VVDAQLKAHDEFLGQIRERMLISQDVMKKQHDKRHREVTFNEGDWV
jgi:hypothetical protein